MPAVRLLCALLLLALPAYAQTPPTPSPTSVFGGNATLAVSTSSARIALPASISTFPVIELDNDGTATVFINIGATNAVTAATTNLAIQAGGSRAFWLPPNSAYVAAIVASGTTTLRISQWNGAPNYIP